ncbi:uncharacterized protein LACBIDRAFT_310461 [Laccaria bicolor S238N-H82]|uniref:Predicted protein n=1 Tax=Laccaria bicolor (strain S238N-H82 / ATCC MYA-4686) TaxID=486041 RepID=B0DUE2_LACBS|nr:uncharacterized protein LACBIDRAFT_310461 [Laccaria bicolor S238N-H82]EDR01787.1 predicted protein [Laccaria bicolor S238N-H82]|eukprot:XP_001887600.1 predicted protein [Laccaria bicolor S238N-H82]
MCQRIAQGTRWNKCGHFQRQFVKAIVDCNSRQCMKSYAHPPSCRQPTCFQTFGPDIERDVDNVDEYCFPCRAAQARAEGRPLT